MECKEGVLNTLRGHVLSHFSPGHYVEARAENPKPKIYPPARRQLLRLVQAITDEGSMQRHKHEGTRVERSRQQHQHEVIKRELKQPWWV